MTPVISPWVFYAMSVVDVFKVIFTAFGIITAIVSIVIIILTFMTKLDYGEDDKDYLQFKAIRKPIIIFAIVTLMLGTLIPSESTITKMIIAQNVTYERVEQATNTVENVYNDIMDLFKEGNNEG